MMSNNNSETRKWHGVQSAKKSVRLIDIDSELFTNPIKGEFLCFAIAIIIDITCICKVPKNQEEKTCRDILIHSLVTIIGLAVDSANDILYCMIHSHESNWNA